MDFVQAADQGLMYRFERLHTPWLDEVMQWATRVGDPWTLDVMAVLAIVGFMALRQWRAAIIMSLTALIAFGISEGAKAYVQRDRPDMAWRMIHRPHSYSFPSGHSLNSMSIYGTAAMLTARRLSRRGVRWALVLLGVGLSLLIGTSRSYLGVHWPTDVLAGWCAGLACALLACWVDSRWDLTRGPPDLSALKRWEGGADAGTPTAPDSIRSPEPGGPVQPSTGATG
jgi:undecaprenyl-diphosphatase